MPQYLQIHDRQEFILKILQEIAKNGRLMVMINEHSQVGGQRASMKRILHFEVAILKGVHRTRLIYIEVKI